MIVNKGINKSVVICFKVFTFAKKVINQLTNRSTYFVSVYFSLYIITFTITQISRCSTTCMLCTPVTFFHWVLLFNPVKCSFFTDRCIYITLHRISHYFQKQISVMTYMTYTGETAGHDQPVHCKICTNQL